MYKIVRPRDRSLHGPRHLLAASILLLFLLYPQCSIATSIELWISDTNGSDFNDCSDCSPCKTFQRAMTVASGNDITKINILPGLYELRAMTAPSGNATESLSIVGHFSNPTCNSTATIPSSDEIGSASITACDLSDASVRNLVMRDLAWVGSGDNLLVRLPRILSSLSLIDSSFLSARSVHIALNERDAPRFAAIEFARLTARGTFHVNTTSSQIMNLSIRSSNFTSLTSFRGHFSHLTIDRSSFSDDLFVNNTNPAARAVALINHSNFLNETVLEVVNLNVTIRSCVFSRAVVPKTARGFETNAFAANYANSWVDARGNYWGDPRGPYSCCNPHTNGVFAMQADTDNWCLEDRCTELVSPIDEAVNYTYSSYSPRWCSYDAYCPSIARTVLISDGASVLILFVICMVFLLVAKRTQRKISNSGLMDSRSFSQSGFNFEPVVDTDAFRNRALLAFDIAAIVVSVFIILSAWMPHIAPSPRYTAFVYLLGPWYYATGGTLTVISCARIVTNLWHLIVVSCSRPSYRSLMANVIVSSIVVQYAGLLRMAASLNDIGATGRYGAYFGPESGVVVLPSGFLITFTTYHWILWLISFVSELLLSAPVIVLSLQIIKKRDFNEISSIKKTIENNQLGSKASLMRGPRLGRPAQVISWTSFVASLLFLGTFAFLLAVFLLRYFEQTASFEASTFVEIMSVMTATVTRTLVVFNCMFVTFLCFAIFRWRFYEPALAMTAGALALGVACSTLEGSIFFTLSMKARGDINGAIVAGVVTSGLALTLFGLAAASFWYLAVMRKRLSSDVITSVYEQLEETYS